MEVAQQISNICETEVTQGLWEAILGTNSWTNPNKPSEKYGLGANYPAYFISRSNILSFIEALNTASGLNFRLPTEAEWEFAARGGNKSKGYIYSGSNTIGDVCWYSDNESTKTHEVKTKSPNELGIYDMSGNVRELCKDFYITYNSNSQTNPCVPNQNTDDQWVIRGGAIGFAAFTCRVSYRYYITSTDNYKSLGFRLALPK